MRNFKVFAVVALLAVVTLVAASWKTLYIANETLVVNDTVAKVWVGKTYPAKMFTDSLTFYIEGVDSIAVDVKLLTYTATGAAGDTVTVDDKAVGEKYVVKTIANATIPHEIFSFKPLISITNSASVKTKPVAFKTLIIYKEQ